MVVRLVVNCTPARTHTTFPSKHPPPHTHNTNSCRPWLLLQQGDRQALPARHVEEHDEQQRLVHFLHGRPDDGGGRLDGGDRLLVGQAGLLLCVRL